VAEDYATSEARCSRTLGHVDVNWRLRRQNAQHLTFVSSDASCDRSQAGWWHGGKGKRVEPIERLIWGSMHAKATRKAMCAFQRPWAAAWKSASKLRHLIDSVARSAGCEEDLDVVFLRGGRWLADSATVVPTRSHYRGDWL
jgi:hypothetical protein